MHTLIHSEFATATAADRRARAMQARRRSGRRHPPPLRGFAASLTARIAVRLDRDAAQRAIA